MTEIFGILGSFLAIFSGAKMLDCHVLELGELPLYRVPS
jgi:hypothetical protein